MTLAPSPDHTAADGGAPLPTSPIASTAWAHIESWVFDLDNTLYPAGQTFYAEMDRRIETFVARALDVDRAEARRLRIHYYHEHGATLNGLMREHAVAPEAFLDFVHDVDVSVLEACAVLRDAIARLPGRKLVFTNSCRAHVSRVTAARGLADLFDGVFDIADAGYAPKPKADAYHRFLDQHGVDPQRAAMFEDMPRNLETPHALGFTTVLVEALADARHPDDPHADPDAEHIHHRTQDLARFLQALHAAPSDAHTPERSAAHAQIRPTTRLAEPVA